MFFFPSLIPRVFGWHVPILLDSDNPIFRLKSLLAPTHSDGVCVGATIYLDIDGLHDRKTCHIKTRAVGVKDYIRNKSEIYGTRKWLFGVWFEVDVM